MAQLVHTPEEFFTSQLDKKSRVLLINPPVQERKYHWLRWNQPSELLRLSSWLKSHRLASDVRLFDFMFPDESGAVPKHKVKETWTGSREDDQLWHFGQPFDAFEKRLGQFIKDGWLPDQIIVSSLTSYWHVSIEKLLIKICTLLGRDKRREVSIVLYGNYPRFEPEHAAGQKDADVACTKSVDTGESLPDFQLYLDAHNRLPAFFALDIENENVDAHLQECLALQAVVQKRRGITRPPAITVAFFNEDVCSGRSQLKRVIGFAQAHPKQLMVEGIAGIEPRSLTKTRLQELKAAAFKSLFVEHARLPGGRIDEEAYEPLLSFLRDEAHAKKSGELSEARLERSDVTGFVAMGLPDDDIDELVRSTLKVNSYFGAVILKPFGYSPKFDTTNAVQRRSKWNIPAKSSPQWFPYVGQGSALTFDDYDNLVRWQNVLNKRVKGHTFDFLGEGTVPRLVRETLVAESWKRHQEAR